MTVEISILHNQRERPFAHLDTRPALVDSYAESVW
jgi:hypothetical protein